MAVAVTVAVFANVCEGEVVLSATLAADHVGWRKS